MSTVYDVADNGKAVFERNAFQHFFPEIAPVAAMEMSEDNFRQLFIHSLAKKIAKDFYSYDEGEDYADDYTLLTP